MAVLKGIPAEYQFHGMIGVSAVMREVFRQLQLLAPLDTVVCLEGEPGTGKHMAAQILHDTGPRADGPCLFLDVSELPPALFEAHFHGHGDDAFSGLLGQRQGLAAQAEGGTLVVEEISLLSREHQRLLIRFLEDQHVRPVGGEPPRKVDVRVICTTSQDLSRQVAAGELERDLYTALRVFTLRLPALRDRPEDLPLLTRHFLSHFMRAHAKEIRGLTPDVASILSSYSWPGHVEQLAEEIERIVILTRPGDWAEPEVLSRRVRGEDV